MVQWTYLAVLLGCVDAVVVHTRAIEPRRHEIGPLACEHEGLLALVRWEACEPADARLDHR